MDLDAKLQQAAERLGPEYQSAEVIRRAKERLKRSPSLPDALDALRSLAEGGHVPADLLEASAAGKAARILRAALRDATDAVEEGESGNLSHGTDAHDKPPPMGDD